MTAIVCERSLIRARSGKSIVVTVSRERRVKLQQIISWEYNSHKKVEETEGYEEKCKLYIHSCRYLSYHVLYTGAIEMRPHEWSMRRERRRKKMIKVRLVLVSLFFSVSSSLVSLRRGSQWDCEKEKQEASDLMVVSLLKTSTDVLLQSYCNRSTVIVACDYELLCDFNCIVVLSLSWVRERVTSVRKWKLNK